MLLAMKIKVVMAVAALATPVALTVAPPSMDRPAADSIYADIPATDYKYRVAGDFSLDGKPAGAPLRSMRLRSNLKIMNRHVTAGEYAACVNEGACPSIPHKAAVADRPIVGVSWRDATAYAEWITRKTGISHRLPTDEEWVVAAGEKAADETQALLDPADPAQAWIARYDAEANRARPFALDPQPIGTFGRNKWGLQDVGGNVWEWTNTCFVRFSIEPAEKAYGNLCIFISDRGAAAGPGGRVCRQLRACGLGLSDDRGSSRPTGEVIPWQHLNRRSTAAP